MKLPSITRIKKITCFEDTVLAGRFSEVVISTPSLEISLRCNPNSDELIISKAKKAKRIGKVSCLASGKYRIEWMWELKNQQGYRDGFRIQIASRRERRVFNIIAIASCLEIYEGSKL
jgi:uncharacterized protein DUF6334